MNLLAIESASTICGVALFINNKIKDIIEQEAPRSHGEKMPIMINDILIKNSIETKDLNGIAISIGPGSYTGLRIGINLARGLARSVNLPLIPVCTLNSMQYKINCKGKYWVLLHSHKNIVFSQRFLSEKSDSEIKCEPFSPQKHFPIFGFNLNSVCDKYISTPPSAKHVGELAIKNFTIWKEGKIDTVIPNYISNII